MWLSILLLSQKSRMVRCPLRRYALVIQTCFSLAIFKVTAHGYTVDNDNLFCLDLKVNFMNGPFIKLPWSHDE